MAIKQIFNDALKDFKVHGNDVVVSNNFLLTPIQSLAVMIETPLGSRVGRPTFGSEFYKLIDKDLNDIWILKAKKAILESTRDSISEELWDKRVDIKDLKIFYTNDKEVKIKVELYG